MIIESKILKLLDSSLSWFTGLHFNEAEAFWLLVVISSDYPDTEDFAFEIWHLEYFFYLFFFSNEIKILYEYGFRSGLLLVILYLLLIFIAFFFMFIRRFYHAYRSKFQINWHNVVYFVIC